MSLSTLPFWPSVSSPSHSSLTRFLVMFVQRSAADKNRRYAEDRGFKFKAGLYEVNTGKELLFETEKEIFHHIGLRWVPPHLRNADG